ncbi:uncharacterized protein LOC120326899 [Styela clava]
MSPLLQLILVCLWSCLLSTANGLSYMYFQTNICSGTAVDGYQCKVEECPLPNFLYGGVATDVIAHTPKVTQPAKLNDVIVTWFLNSDGNPGLNITVKATSPDSPQQYEVNVMADSYPTPIYCGKIQTPEPAIGFTPEKQELGLEMRCDGERLKANMGIQLAVQVQGDPVMKETPYSISFRIPSCDDKIMHDSNECIAERKKKIQFNIKQKRNSTVVILAIKTAYLKQDPSSNVYVTIREQDDNIVDGWKTLGAPTTLTWPQRITVFNNLAMGKTYQIVVWRSGEFNRFAKVITMKIDQKDPRFDDYKNIQRLQKRRARLARRISQYGGVN